MGPVEVVADHSLLLALPAFAPAVVVVGVVVYVAMRDRRNAADEGDDEAHSANAAPALLAAGCGGSNGSGDTAGSAPATQTSTGVPQMSDQQSPPDQLVVDVTISGGEVTPTNEQLQTTVGVPILLRVNSDAEDQVHVHSTPEHTFKVEPKSGQSFQFTVDVPGRVDVELHELNRTIATIAVQ